MRTIWFSWVALSLVSIADGAGAQDDEARCLGLRGLSIPSDGTGLPSGGADISTVRIAAAGETPYCDVLGSIDTVDPEAPDITLQVNLPLERNGRGLHYGGGASTAQVRLRSGWVQAHDFSSARVQDEGTQMGNRK
jgi:hypothetical protein